VQIGPIGFCIFVFYLKKFPLKNTKFAELGFLSTGFQIESEELELNLGIQGLQILFTQAYFCLERLLG